MGADVGDGSRASDLGGVESTAARRPRAGVIVGQRVAPEKLRRARELRRDMTPEEATLWHRLRDNRLDGLAFHRQQVIDGFIVDFFCAAARLVIEVDGAVHRQQAEYDAERDQVLAGRGLCVLRFSNDDIRFRSSAVLDRIRAACDPSVRRSFASSAADHPPPPARAPSPLPPRPRGG